MAERRDILGIKFDDLSLTESVSLVENFVRERGFHFIVDPDMSRVARALRTPLIRKIYNHADLTLSDGTALVLASRVLGAPLKCRVPCSDLAERLLALSQEKGYRVFILRGGSPADTDKIADNLRRKYPGIKIAGKFSVPYDFKPDKADLNERIIAKIVDAKPDLLMFSLGCPKEEYWVWGQRQRLKDVPVCIAIGGTMDIFLGKARLAPQWMRDRGLEWLFRVIREPGRLLGRYLASAGIFFYFVFRQIMADIFSFRALRHKISAGFRKRRFAFFKSLIASLPRPLRILDAGGTQSFWQQLAVPREEGMEVWLLNLSSQDAQAPYFRNITGDAREMRQFKDKEFDIVFSNSVIEHVGDFDGQRRMADEIRRVGKKYFLQTPNRYFPIEPHFLFPFFQFFPHRARVWLVTSFHLGWHGRILDRNEAAREVGSIRLLSENELRELFPEGKISREKFLGLTKSFNVCKM